MDKKEIITYKTGRIVSVISIILVVSLFLSFIFLGPKDDFLGYSISVIAHMIIYIGASIILHEFGHYFFGKLSGYKLNYFQVLFLKLYKKEGKLRIKFNALPILGQCMMTYDKKTDEMKYRSYIYGGAIFNLVICALSLIGMLLLFICAHTYTYKLGILFVVNAYLFMSNGIPLNIQGTYNDALNLKLMKKYDSIRRAVLNQLKLQYYTDNDYPLSGFSKESISNDNTYIPYWCTHSFPFQLYRTIENVTNNRERPFEPIRISFSNRSNYPSLYNQEMIGFIFMYDLLHGIDYRWIIASKEYRKLFQKPDTSDPFIRIIYKTKEYRDNEIDFDKLSSDLDEIGKWSLTQKLSRLESDFYVSLINLVKSEISKEIRKKEEENLENASSDQRTDSENLL